MCRLRSDASWSPPTLGLTAGPVVVGMVPSLVNALESVMRTAVELSVSLPASVTVTLLPSVVSIE